MKLLFRPHRGLLADSMAEVKEVEWLDDIQRLYPKSTAIFCEHYCYDDRIKWDTWLISDSEGVLGMASGDLKWKAAEKDSNDGT